MRVWTMQDATARFGELLTLALAQGPQQIVTENGAEVVVISTRELDQLRGRPSFVELMRDSPLADYELDLTRDHSPMRGAC